MGGAEYIMTRRISDKELFKFNSDNQIEILSTPIFYDVEDVSPEFFLQHYKDFLWQYTADGQASMETLRKYFINIDQFLRWCVAIKKNPFNLKEAYIIQYRSLLYQRGYKQASINAKIAAIKKFYFVAKKLKVINENIAEDVHGKIVYDDEKKIRFLTIQQLQHVIDCIPKDRGALYYRRISAMIAMMGKEGLRRKEVRLMSWEDIDYENKIILIKGKGHNRYIYPSNDTFSQLEQYKEELDAEIPISKQYKDDVGTPCFICMSNHAKFKRITLDGISSITKDLLLKAGLKQKGISCHLFRHTFAVLLYAATKDLRLVQSKMGHTDPKITSKYAQSIDNMQKRFDNAIPVMFSE